MKRFLLGAIVGSLLLAGSAQAFSSLDFYDAENRLRAYVMEDGPNTGSLNVLDGNGVYRFSFTYSNDHNDILLTDHNGDERVQLGSFDNGDGDSSAFALFVPGSSGEPFSVLATQSATRVVISNLPTTDPGYPGQLWNDNGTLKISAGP